MIGMQMNEPVQLLICSIIKQELSVYFENKKNK